MLQVLKCAATCGLQISAHGAQVTYVSIWGAEGNAVAALNGKAYDWQVLCNLRGWCRLRIGVVTIRCKAGMRSVARYQSCIFCGSVVRNGTVHSVGRCAYWRDLSHSFMQAAGISIDVSADPTTGLMPRCSPRKEGSRRQFVLARPLMRPPHVLGMRMAALWNYDGPGKHSTPSLQ